MKSKVLIDLDSQCLWMEEHIKFLENQLREAQKENIALLNSQIKHNEKMAVNQLELILKAVAY